METSGKMEKLLTVAAKSGATKAVIIKTAEIVTKESLAEKCSLATCPNYGLSLSCPPSAGGPEVMREKLKTLKEAIFFRLDVPSSILLSCGVGSVFELLSSVATDVERQAIAIGFKKARAYTAGGCKITFCGDFDKCQALSGGACRNPDYARHSMSGYGVDVAKLVKAVGWELLVATPEDDEEKLSSVFGLILTH
jgi:predicted metal-binding protein